MYVWDSPSSRQQESGVTKLQCQPLWGGAGQLFSYDAIIRNNGKDFPTQINLKLSKTMIIPVATYPAACMSVI